jgi:iduronate 2-sulfatase
MRTFPALAAVVGLTMLAWTPSAPAQQPSKKPNILFIISDDLNCSLGCYGNTVVKSPNIDKLAKRGVLFSRAYCQYPVCNPSRTSFLTGLKPDSTKILDNKVPLRKELPDAVTLPEYLRSHGYVTISIGKVFHRGLVFDEVKQEMDDPKSWTHSLFPTGTPLGKKGEGRNMSGGKYAWCRWLAAEGEDTDQPDGQFAALAVKMLEKYRDQPFFLAVGFHKPHDPFIAPKKYFDMYPLDKLPVPKVPDKRSAEVPFALPKGTDFSTFTDQDKREFLRCYYAGVTFMDAQVGKLLEALERLGLAENTIVVLIGDHGYHLGEHGWWNKNTLFEMSCRPPLIVAAPGSKGQGKSCARLVEFVDLYPTLTELCGLKTPAKLEGISFRPLLDEPERAWKKAAFTQVQRGKVAGYTMRTERWRYTEWDGGKAGVELYDHNSDPGEYHNLATEPQYAMTVEEMRKLLRAGWKAAAP